MNHFWSVLLFIFTFIYDSLGKIKEWLKKNPDTEFDNPQNIFRHQQHFKNLVVTRSKKYESDLPSYIECEHCAFAWSLEDDKVWKPIWANKKVLELYKKDTLQDFLQGDYSEISEQQILNLQNILTDCEKGKDSSERFFLYPNGTPIYIQLISVPLEMNNRIYALSFFVEIQLNMGVEDRIFFAESKFFGTRCTSVYDEDLNILMKNTNSKTRFRLTNFPNDTIYQHGFTKEEISYIHMKCKQSKKFGVIIAEKEVNSIQADKVVVYNVAVYLIRNPNNGAKAILVIETDISKISKISNGLINVFHELRVSLSGIVGALELLKTKKFSKDNELLLTTAENSTYVLSSILDDMLDFSRLRSAYEFPIHLAEVTPDILFQELDNIVDSFAPMIYKKELDFHIDYPLSLINQKNLTFNIDLKRIRQILSNFVLNSQKFTTKGIIQISLHVETNRLIFIVKDSGKGIPIEKMNTLFDPFTQIHPLDSREGTGIGLTIANELVKKMNGTIEVKSTVGSGSEFLISLPLDREIQIEKNSFKKFEKVILILNHDQLMDKIPQIMSIIDQFCKKVELVNTYIKDMDITSYDLVICDSSIINKNDLSEKLNVDSTLIIYKINENLDDKLKKFHLVAKPIKPYFLFLELKKLLLVPEMISKQKPKFYLHGNVEEYPGILDILDEYGSVEQKENPKTFYRFIFILGELNEDTKDFIFNTHMESKSIIIRIAKNEEELKEKRRYLKIGFDDVLIPNRRTLKQMLEKWRFDRDLSHSLDDQKIIIAEDNRINRFLLNNLIDKFGNSSTIPVETAEELIEKFDDHSIVFSDQFMNKLTGIDAFKEIKCKNEARVIFVLSSGESLGRKELESSEVDEFILKPISIHDLKRFVIKFQEIIHEAKQVSK